jgi:hypothetical protein
VEVREDGEWLAELAILHFELRVERKNPLVHLSAPTNAISPAAFCA